MKNSSVIAIAIACLLLGGTAGYLVTTTFLKPESNARTFNLAGGQLGRNGAGAVRINGGGMVAGELLKKDDGSLSIKLRDGSSKLVLTTPSTETLKMTTGTLEGLNIGENVIVSGTQNSDGSVTAQTVQIRPTGAMMQFGAANASQPNQTGRQTNEGSGGQGNQIFYVGGPDADMPPPPNF